MPILYEFQEELQDKHPTFSINVGQDAIGSLTSYQGYQVYLECFRSGYINDEPNCLVLDISLRSLDTRQPFLDSLGVYWGATGIPPAQVTLDLLDTDIAWGASAIKKILLGLPQLKDNLSLCLLAWENLYPMKE